MSLWRHRDFMRLWAGQTVSLFGSEISDLAIPTVAVLTLHQGVLQVGILKAVERVPFPLFALIAGAYVDRWPRRRVMIAADVLRALALSAIPISWATGSLSLNLLYVVALLMGVGTVFFDLAYLSYVPSVLSGPDVVRANTRMQGSMSAASVAGPGIAGVAVQAIGAARAVGLDALSFLVSAISVLAIRTAEAPRVRQRAGVRRDIGVGLRFVFGHPILGRLYLATALGMIGAHVLDAVMYPFMYNQLHLVPAQLGLILATAATGSIAGVLLSPWFVRRLGLGRVVGGFMAGFCLALFALPLALLFPPAIVIVPAFWLSTMFDAVQNINQLSLRQALTPESMQGRMHSVVRTVTWTALPVSSLLGGIAANYLGPVTTLLAGGTVGVLGSVAVLLSPAGRIQEFPAAPATDAPASPDH